MALTLVLPEQLAEVGPHDGRIELGGCATVGDALRALGSTHPAVHDRIVTERGEVRPHLNVFVGRSDIRWSGGLQTPVRDGDEILVLRSVSGG